MLLGERLRQIREALGLTQREVGRRAGLTSSYISRVETHRTTPRLQVLHRLARALAIPVYAFFLADGQRIESPPKPDPLLPRRLLLFLSRMDRRQRDLLLATARAMLRDRRKKQAGKP